MAAPTRKYGARTSLSEGISDATVLGCASPESDCARAQIAAEQNRREGINAEKRVKLDTGFLFSLVISCQRSVADCGFFSSVRPRRWPRGRGASWIAE